MEDIEKAVKQIEATAHEYLRVDLKLPAWQALLISGKIGVKAEVCMAALNQKRIEEVERYFGQLIVAPNNESIRDDIITLLKGEETKK